MSIPSALDAHAAEPADKRYIVRSPMRADLLRVVEMIEARFHEPLSLAQLALAAGLSRYRFVAVFRNEVGMTPHQFINYVRVGHAVQHLVDGMSPASAALDVGFVDQSHLIRQFKYFMGMTPQVYMNGTLIRHSAHRVRDHRHPAQRPA